MDSGLVDRIYESAFVPELWPDVLDDLVAISESRGASLFITKADVTAWAASPVNREATAKAVNEGWLWRGQVVARLFAARHAGFLSDLDLLTPDEKAREPIYRDLWSQYGVSWAVGTAIPIPTGEKLVLAVHRRTERGPMEPAFIHRLDELRPHLARSAFLSARLQLERARMASETLAALGLPALVLDERGKVLAVNRLIEGMTGCVHWRAQNRVSLTDRAADRLLRDAISTIGLAPEAGVRSFPIRDAGADAMMVAHVIPVRLSARDIFLRCAAVIVLTPVTAPQAPPVEVVQSLFDLTPAEARVARGLASGKTVEDIASDGGVSPNTVRTHVRGVLEKTGCNRQVEVVALLTGISAVRLTNPI